MFKYAIIAATFAFTSSAAATDLPNRKQAPLPPTPVRTTDGAFFGVRGGVVNENLTVGGVTGYRFNRMAAVEANYDYINSSNDDKKANIGTVNITGGAPLGPSMVYTLAGVGYRWSDVKDEPVWNVGAGIRYDLTKSLELDGRYRYIANFENERTSNVFSVGVNFKF